MLTMLDLLGLISAALPWMQRAQVRRLERVGERVQFSDESRHAIERAQYIAQADGANAVSPVHIARAALECRTPLSQGAAPRRERPLISHAEAATPSSLPFTYPAFAVLAEAVRLAADARLPAATPDHLLLGTLRKRTARATQYLASRGVTLASLEGPEGGAARVRRVRT